MTRHHLISGSVDLVEFVCGLLPEDRPLSRSMVVFPGKRPGYFLHKYLADRFRAAYIPPRVLAADGFVQELAQELDLPGKTVDAIDCLAVIYRLNDKSRVVARKNPELTLDEFLVWGYKLFEDFEELYIEGVSAESLKTVETLVEDKLPAGIRSKLNALSDLYRSFYRELENQGLITRSLQYRTVADRLDRIRLEGLDHVFICGFFALTGAEKRIFGKLAEDERVRFVFQEGPGIDRIISDLGVKPQRTGGEPKDPAIRFFKAMDGHAEIFKLNQVLQKEKDLGSRDVIVVPKAEALFPLVQNTLGFKKDYNISMPYPVYRTPLNTLIGNLARLRENKQDAGYPVADYMRVVLHPYVKNIYLDRSSSAGRIIFHAVEEKFMDNQQRFLSPPDLEQDPDLLDDCVQRLIGFRENKFSRQTISDHLKKIHDVMIRPFDEIRDIADIAEKIIKVISFISNESPANQHPHTASFIKAMIDGLHTLQVSGLGPERFAAVDRYFRMILNYLRQVTHPFPGTPVRGLQVLGFLETRSIKFDRVFLLDVNEGVLPASAKDDSILPYAVRKALELPTCEDEERISRYHFETLVSGSRQADIFYVEGEENEKSRFCERLIWEIQKKDAKLEHRSEDIFFPVQFQQKDPASIKKSGLFMEHAKGSLTFSPTGINTYLKCPLKYYYGEMLGLEAKTGVAEDPDAKGIGSIVHRILMEYFIPRIGEPLRIARSDFAAMDKAVDGVFHEIYPDADRGSVYLIKTQTRRQLRRLLQHHQGDQFKNAKVLECENWREKDRKPKKYNKSVSATLRLSGNRAVTLKGKIDRVDDRAGRIYIIDYKTNSALDLPDPEKFDLKKRDEWPETLISIQLPSYIYLYSSRNPKVKIEDMNAGLMLMGGKEIVDAMLFDEGLAAEERVKKYEQYLDAIKTLIEEILDPENDFNPSADSRSCKWCPYQTICGRQWVINESW